MAGPADSYNAEQDYGFHDYRIDNSNSNTVAWQFNLLPHIVIQRFVENTAAPGMPPAWRYRIVKSGSTNTAPLP